MNKKAILFAALLGAAILAIAGCENLTHDLHKKGGGAAKTSPGGNDPGGPGGPGSGSATIELGVAGDFALETPYNYDVSAVGFEHPALTISNTGTADSDPLTVRLTGPGADQFTVTPDTIAGIAAGGSVTCSIKPIPGLWLGTYTAIGVTVAVGGDQLPEPLNKDFTVGFSGVIDVGNPANSLGTGIAFTYDNVNLFTIQDNMAVQVTGSSTGGSGNRIEVNGAGHTRTYIELKDAIITGNTSYSPLKLGNGAKVTLNLVNQAAPANQLKTANQNSAGLEVPDGTTLEITGSGALEAANTNGSGLGAGIGGGNGSPGGNITISDGTVTASGDYGAGIGGGNGADGGNVTISGGTVTASGGSNGGAGIGGGWNGAGGTIEITGGTVTASGSYGAGIGGGYLRDGGNITISGGTVTARNSLYGAGIGGGGSGDGGDIVISTDTGAVSVYAYSNYGQGIGEGSGGGASGTFTTAGTPVIFATSINHNGSPYVIGPSESIDGGAAATTAISGDPPRPTVTLTGSFTIHSGATLTIPPGGRLDLNGQTLTNNGTIVVQNGGTLTGTPVGPGRVIQE
jgi:hypothetical protein